MISTLLQQEIESVFTVVRERSSSHELVIICPEANCRDKTGNRAINLETGKTFCWRCGKGKHGKGSIVSWARALGFSFSNAAGPAYSNVPIEDLLDQRAPLRAALPSVSEIKLPAGFISLDQEPDSVYVKLIARMAKRKNLALEDFVRAGAGFTRQDPIWEPFCIFPVTEYAIPVYYQGRLYSEEAGQPTKRFPNRKDVKYGARYWVYNIDRLRAKTTEVAVVVESILNVLSLERAFRKLGVTNVVPVAAFKHHMSREQALKVIQSGVKEVCLLFDHDATEEAWKSAAQLASRVSVSIAEMPAGPGNKKQDPNDNVDVALESLADRKPFSATGELDRLLASS